MPGPLSQKNQAKLENSTKLNQKTQKNITGLTHWFNRIKPTWYMVTLKGVANSFL